MKKKRKNKIVIKKNTMIVIMKEIPQVEESGHDQGHVNEKTKNKREIKGALYTEIIGGRIHDQEIEIKIITDQETGETLSLIIKKSNGLLILLTGIVHVMLLIILSGLI